MSLDVSLTASRPTEIYHSNITHNLARMATEAGLYDCLWRPDEHGITTARPLITPLRDGLRLLESDPPRFKVFDPPNKWGSYESLVKFVREYLAACAADPDTLVEVSR